ncbi:MAG: helix-turn-helix domain-containing protein [Brevundimonas sp.]|uniref:helix-turn-helix domain-containing protein n=1 Tax=Brevundimonas sp. TaxID=1871086 RepID=UPI00403356B8
MTSAFMEAPTFGAGLRATRKASGRSLAELSVVTKVHRRYLVALEEGDFSALPSRVFAVGYVRAYAGALGLDEQLAVERFKRESPDLTAPLQPPVGAAFQDVRRRSQPVLIAIAVAGVAVIGWNVFQRVNLMRAPQPSDIASVPDSWSRGAGQVQTGDVLQIGGPKAAPPDQTIPALYVTPGLEEQLTGVSADDAAIAQAATAVAPVQAAFNPRGAIYGAPATASHVVLQAKKAGALVVRLTDGRVLFARQLAAGEAWRAPIGVSATVDVSDPAAFDVYMNGEHGGVLDAVLTPLAQLNARAEAMGRQAAAQAAARTAAAQAAAQAAAPQATPASPAPSPVAAQ